MPLKHCSTDEIDRILSPLPQIGLGIWPTPLHKLERLRVFNVGQLWIKRDDLAGFVHGGSKGRGLEFLIGDALARQMDTIVTGGMASSNYLRDAVIASAMFDMKSIVIVGNESFLGLCKNRELFKRLGVTVNAIEGTYDDLHERVRLEYRISLQKGIKAYLIPAGGFSPLAALGFVKAAQELIEQLEKMEVSADTLFIAHGGGAAQAGLMFGLKMLSANIRVIGISAGSNRCACKDRVRFLLAQISDLLDVRVFIDESNILVEDMFSQFAEGSGIEESFCAIERVLVSTGILLDPIYTARAFLGMQNILSKDPKENAIFWHTGGRRELAFRP